MVKDIIDKAIDYYGTDNQLDIAQEENAELIQAISKLRRAKNDEDYYKARENAKKEIADVQHTLRYVKRILGFTEDEIEEVIQAIEKDLEKAIGVVK